VLRNSSGRQTEGTGGTVDKAEDNVKKPKRKKPEPSVVWRKLEEIEKKLDIIFERIATLLAIKEARKKLAVVRETGLRRKRG
jgi:hypothetical protein